MEKKRVYTFGNGKAEGKADMRNLLGGKGANLAEMNLIGVPVPPGFTITTDVCSEYYELGQEKVVELLKSDVEKAIANVETLMNSKFGDIENPLLVSVRSGARASMPGMMDTILNLGLNDEVVEGLTRKTGNARFAWDSYRRFVQMYGDVVLGMKPTSKEDIDPFEAIIEEVKVNSALNKIENTLFYAGDMKDILTTDFINQHGRPDVIITDPPRAGMHDDVINTILLAEPERIVYVSCNPATQARDLSLLDVKYAVKKVQPVDMFPHTHHVENVVLLEKKK